MRIAARIAGWLVAVVFFLVVVAYLALNREHGSLDAAARAGAPGKFARLTDGVTHYDLAGASDDGDQRHHVMRKIELGLRRIAAIAALVCGKRTRNSGTCNGADDPCW